MRRVSWVLGVWFFWSGSALWAGEVHPRLTLGGADVVERHTALAGSVRVDLGRIFFVEPELMALNASDHTDWGPMLFAGVAGPKEWRVRPHLALGAGPVRSATGDRGIYCASLGAMIPLSRDKAVFVLPEGRLGLFGESTYGQASISIGFSLGRR